jgi:regulatory protein|uniref:Regulatory protein RecX n=1 Tax=Mesoaciditoga lauensis TaxID=1495039 RepID=A0A7V3RF01_9BACT
MKKEKTLDNAKKDALMLLKVRPRSEWELSNRLLQKGYDDKVIENLIYEMKQKGFINDEKFAKLFAVDELELKFKGPKYIEYELKELKVDEEIIAKIVDEMMEGVDLKELFKLFLKNHPNDSYDKLFQKLVKRGFDPYTVKKLVREISKEMEVE